MSNIEDLESALDQISRLQHFVLINLKNAESQKILYTQEEFEVLDIWHHARCSEAKEHSIKMNDNEKAFAKKLNFK
jgi:hypothetical protein